jgi:DNA invertase Pin-like site-specific DNA recombinase
MADAKSTQIIGYRRVSSTSQSLDRQDLPDVTGKVFEEKVSGKNTSDRPALLAMIEYVREGDVVHVHSIDRLARDLRDLQAIVTQINDKGATITFLSESLTFSTKVDDPLAKLQLQMMGAFSEFERALIRKRQEEGIAKKLERGAYHNKKRKPSVDYDKVVELHNEGLSTYKIAAELNCSRMTVHRVLKRQDVQPNANV